MSSHNWLYLIFECGTSALANADVSDEVRRKIVGHESSEVHAIYTHHEQETLARAIGKLPNV